MPICIFFFFALCSNRWNRVRVVQLSSPNSENSIIICIFSHQEHLNRRYLVYTLRQLSETFKIPPIVLRIILTASLISYLKLHLHNKALHQWLVAMSKKTNKSGMNRSIVEGKPAVSGYSLVNVGQQGHICKMKGEAPVGCFQRGEGEVRKWPQHIHQTHCSSSR